jgi:hypothetical protein
VFTFSPSVSSSPSTHINHTQQQTSSLRTHSGLSKVAEAPGQIENGALDPTVTPPKLEVIAKSQDVHSLFGITQVGGAVSNGAVDSFADSVLYGNSTLWIYLLGFKEVLLKPFLSNQYGPIHGMTALPYAMHIILAADSIRSEVLRIDIETGGIEVANKDIDLHSFIGASFPTAVNGLKIFDDYFYFTGTSHQTLNRDKIDKSDHRMRGYKAIDKFDADFTPDDSVLDEDGSAYVPCWMDKLVKTTPAGKISISSKGLLAGPACLALSKDEKHLYAVSAGLDETGCGGQATKNKFLFNPMLVSSSNLAQKQTLDIAHALQPIDTPLSTNTRFLMSTKWCHRRNLKMTVDPNGSSIKTLSNSLRSFEVS